MDNELTSQKKGNTLNDIIFESAMLSGYQNCRDLKIQKQIVNGIEYTYKNEDRKIHYKLVTTVVIILSYMCSQYIKYCTQHM